MSHAAHVGFEVAGRLAQVGGALHVGIERAAANARIRREAAVDSVQELAARLQESRGAQRAAERRAASAEAELAGALSEIRTLRDALRREKSLSDGLREICGV